MQSILNKEVIHSIQSYLAGMDWAQKEYKGEELNTFLKGVAAAMFNVGLRFKLCSRYKSTEYITEYYVEVRQYSDPYDCWSDIKAIGEIYAHSINVF